MWRRKALDAVATSFPWIERALGHRVVLQRADQLHTLPEIHFLRRFMREFAVDCVFDVGANVGQYARMLRTRVGYRGLIISFEPDPQCAETLREGARGDPNWRIEECALSDTVGEASFNVMSEPELNSLLEPDAETMDKFVGHFGAARSIRVKTTTIAAYLASNPMPSGIRRPYLKLDTQGNDIRVAEGAGASLARFCGVQTELSIVPIYKDAVDYREAIRYFEGKGFKLSAFVPNNPGHFPNLVEMDCILHNPAFSGIAP